MNFNTIKTLLGMDTYRGSVQERIDIRLESIKQGGPWNDTPGLRIPMRNISDFKNSEPRKGQDNNWFMQTFC